MIYNGNDGRYKDNPPGSYPLYCNHTHYCSEAAIRRETCLEGRERMRDV